MHKYLRLFLVLLTIISNSHTWAQTVDIAIDEKYEDWDNISSQVLDQNDMGNDLDLLQFKVANDQDNIYFYCEVSDEINLVNSILPQDIILHIDTDNNPNTGQNIQAKYGVDLSIDFLQREAYYYNGTKIQTVYFGDLGFLSAPTVSTTKFEIAIARNSKANGKTIFSTDSIRVLFEEKTFGDRMPNKGNLFVSGIKNQNKAAYTPIDLDKKDDENIRVCSYNVLFNSGWETDEKVRNLESIVKAIDGDVYGFQESRSTTAAEAIDYLNKWIPLDNESWHASNSSDLVTCSKWPIIESWTFNRHLAVLIDLPSEYETDLFVINTHLSCCSNNSGRQEQVDNFCSFLRDAKTMGGDIDLAPNTPIVYLGDFNLVGFKQQIETILKGDIQDKARYGQPFLPDWDSTELVDALPYHSDNDAVYTWRSLGSNKIYPPGRLDFQFYTNSVMSLEKAFVINTAEMSNARLKLYKLAFEDSERTSDHLPIVVDYAISSLSTDINEKAKASLNIRIYPNPTSKQLNIACNFPIKNLTIRDLMGKVVFIPPNVTSSINIEDLKPGIYFLELQTEKGRIQKRFIVE